MVTDRQTPPYIELSLPKYCKVAISYTTPVYKAKTNYHSPLYAGKFI